MEAGREIARSLNQKTASPGCGNAVLVLPKSPDYPLGLARLVIC